MVTTSSPWTVHTPTGGEPLALKQQNAGRLMGLELGSTPVQLTLPATESDSQPPCELLIEWGDSSPLRCLQLKLELVSSARHAEIHFIGTRRTMLGEEEAGEVYVGTKRGAKQPPVTLEGADVFQVSEEFTQLDQSILNCTTSIRIKFVSLTGEKTTLSLHSLRCCYMPMHAAQMTAQPNNQRYDFNLFPLVALALNACNDVDSSARQTPAEGLLPAIGNLTLGGAFNPQEYLLKFQQMLERDVEAKITQALDAKLTGLSQRLALSELRLFQLHEQMQTREVKSDANIDRLQQQLKALESQVKYLAALPLQTPEKKAMEQEADD